ncbi:hypothetical protein N7540_003101 [Penicillium herquei]|nr:hypothetical protein N7540_003101 [Penicillium herquei]
MSQQRETYTNSSPPRTPPSQTAKYRPKQKYPTRPSIRDAFPDAMEHAPRVSESGDERDPHDLSLSPKHAARTSIVDNMLLSLDQFGAPDSSIMDDYRLFNSAFDIESHGRYRGHTFSSSMSSDVDYGYDDGTNRYATITNKGRRSNSSSNYQSLPRRVDSGRGRDAIGSRSGAGTMPRPSDSRKGSKGSQSTADFAYSVPRRRADSDDLDRRSPSFDCGPKKYAPYSNVDLAEDTMLYDDDAAPTPSIPAGPRKFTDYRTPTGPASRTPVASRRNSVKSSQAPQVRKARPDNIGTGTLKMRDNDFDLSCDTNLDLPPVFPASVDHPAPSPTISYNKPTFPPPEPPAVTTTTTVTTNNNLAANSRDRPGFFRRVFGSSKAASPGPADSPGSNVSDLSYLQENETKDPTGATVNLKGGKLQPPPPKNSATMASSPTPARQVPHQVVNKKSSFFRRRKKSVVDHVPPPIALPQDLASHALELMKPQPSPVSSLRQVMHQYLADGVPVKQDAKENRAGDLPSQKPRESVSAPSGGSKKHASTLQPPSSARGGQDRLPLVESCGPDDRSSRSADTESTTSVDPPLQEKGSLMGASPLSPVVEDFSRSIQSTHVKTADIHDAAQESLTGTPRLTIPNNVPESPAISEVSHYQTASTTPVIESEELKPIMDEFDENFGGPGEAVEDGPTASDREQAQKLFDSQDQVVGNDPAAAWLGDPDRAMVREAYMRLFNWSHLNILAALRSLCQRLILKGETQQVDRVLDAFSNRWCDCNPSHGFKATDVVHTICYSILLLNTDLHLADIEQKMTKAQFVRNTMPTIHRVAMDAAPEGFETLRPTNRSKTSGPEMAISAPSSARSATFPADVTRSSLDADNTGRGHTDGNNNEAGPLVNTPFIGTVRAWEQQVEAVLKDFYTSIHKERLPLHGAQPVREVSRMSSTNFLGPTTGILRRSPSTISKSGSDIFPRGRSADSRHAAARWSSKPRSRAGRLYPPSVMGSSRTSLDDQSSVWSPTASSTWSKYSLGKFTSASVDSFGSDYPRGEYQQSIGFANALSQAIIREDSATIYSYEESDKGPLLEDETLALAGAPWAKEGSLKHKHHLDAVDKRAKDRNWNDCFAVIQQGWMRLFSFTNTTKSMRQKAKQRGGVVVGGGNWTENAEELWKFMLRQTIASALPPPGYSKSRPHVWALSLPTGAVHLFQAGTPEIVREFVSTANYWSARLSKEPLVGGISNIEYGWSDAVINSALIHAGEDRSPPPSSGAPRQSIQSSIRSSIDHQGVRPKLPADRVNISDWSPPQQSMVASHQTEEAQLTALQAYVKNVEDDLQRHNELRSAMNLAFSPRHPNAAKAMANWERKSSYLLREIVKFRTYIDSLRNAINQKQKIYASSNHIASSADGEAPETAAEPAEPIEA